MPPPRNPRNRSKAFTLAELLISLALLGVIATFTIPKIIMAQSISANNAKAKEAMGMLAAAYQQAQMAGSVDANTLPYDLTPYMNFVSVDTTSENDVRPGGTSQACDSTIRPCIKLHNGGLIRFVNDRAFGGTATTNFIEVVFDPDTSQYTNSTSDGPLKAIQFQLYYNGFITTGANLKPNSYSGGQGPFGPDASLDPFWFSL